MAIELPKALDAIPVVLNGTERDARYPSPATNQRVFRVDSNAVELWTGTAWSTVTGGYSEGSWTPTLQGTTTAGTYTYTQQVGRYVKVGALVLAQFYVATSANPTPPTGNVVIGGLPFVPTNITGLFGAGAIREHGAFTLTGGFSTLEIGVSPGSAALVLTKSGSGLASLAVPATDVGSAPYVLGTVVYRTG